MPRKPAFDAASLYVHFQPWMVSAFPVSQVVPGAMQDVLERMARPSNVSLGARLRGLKRLIDDQELQASKNSA